MSDCTFLTKEQLEEGPSKLNIFKKLGHINAELSDFSIILSGAVGEFDFNKDKRYGYYWTKTKNSERGVYCVDADSDSIDDDVTWSRTRGCRLVKPFSSMAEPTLKSIIFTNEGIKKAEYGEYPQTVVDNETAKKLESYYQVSCLTETGKTYTIDANNYNSEDIFKPKTLKEFEYNGKKYVRVQAYVSSDDMIDVLNFPLSKGQLLNNNEVYWIEVEPIVWLIDDETNLAISEKLLFAGIQFDSTRKYHGNFYSTDVKIFIDDYFSKEMLSNEMAELQAELQNKEIGLFKTENYEIGDIARGIGKETDVAIYSGCTEGSFLLSDDYDLYGTNCKYVKSVDGSLNIDSLTNSSKLGVRPVIEFGNENYIISNGRKVNEHTYEINIGEFPQSCVLDNEEIILSNKLKQGELKKTGKVFTFNNVDNINGSSFKPIEYDEYQDSDGNKYIRIIPIEEYQYGKTHRWIKVEPLSWFYDTHNKLLYTRNIIVSGIMLGKEGKIRNFKQSEVYKYLNNYFKQEVFKSYGVTKSNQNLENTEEKAKAKKKENVYDFKFEQVDEEGVIKGCINGNIPVFLHGESSEGKSARVKQIDSDCVILYLSNATPESLNGKSVYDPNKGEIIDMPPSWYVKLKKKCEEEPDKIHVLFFDELTNALPSIQGMVFNIILDREVNGVWKLPSNCRIAVSGNDMDESLAANELAKPLFNRLAHVYIKTTVPNWLKWASKNNIHPAIYAFVAYHGAKVLRTPYNGEKPHADPRRWEMASKLLYKTNKPYLLRGIIGEGMTDQLVAFCKQTVITLDDVINHNYSKEDLNMNTGQKYMTAVGLSIVDEKNLKEVREFAYNLGSEIGAVFDSMWCQGEETRTKKLVEIDMLKGGIKR